MSGPGDGGVIHDIGYRGYTGPRLGADYIGRSLFVHSLKGAYGLGRATRAKVMPILLLALMIAPAVVIVSVVNALGEKELPIDYTEYAVRLQIVIAVFVASQAPQLVSRDLRFHVVELYFARPLSRATYVNAKFLAMTVALFILMAAPLLVLYLGALLAKLAFWKQTGMLFIGLVGALIFALILASIGLLIAAATPRRGIGVAAIIAVLLVLSGISGIMQEIAFELGNVSIAGYAGLLSPFALVDGVQTWVLSTEPTGVAGPPGTLGGAVFVGLTVAVIVGCYALLLRRYRSVAVT